MTSPKIIVIIPAYNEAQSIGLVLAEIPSVVSEVIVVNNRSTDETAAVAKKAGASVNLLRMRSFCHSITLGICSVTLLASL